MEDLLGGRLLTFRTYARIAYPVSRRAGSEVMISTDLAQKREQVVRCSRRCWCLAHVDRWTKFGDEWVVGDDSKRAPSVRSVREIPGRQSSDATSVLVPQADPLTARPVVAVGPSKDALRINGLDFDFQ